MVSLMKTASALALAAAVLLPLAARPLQAAAPNAPAARMTVIQGKDVSGTIYKKLGLPSLQYCWDMCIKESQCTGARWGVIQGDVAGLCLLLSGELTVKEVSQPKTEDGKAIQVIAGRKQAIAASGGGT